MVANTPSVEIENMATVLAKEFGYSILHMNPKWVNRNPVNSLTGWFGFTLEKPSCCSDRIDLVWLSAHGSGNSRWNLSVDKALTCTILKQGHAVPYPSKFQYMSQNYKQMRDAFKKNVGVLS